MVMKNRCPKCFGQGVNGLIRFRKCDLCNGDGIYPKMNSFPPPAPPPRQYIPDIKSDSPTKPSHYGKLDVFTYAKEHFTVEEVNAYHQITAIKYITRAGKKDGNPFEQDIKKAIVHLEECLKGEEL